VWSIDRFDQSGLRRDHPGRKIKCPTIFLTDQKMTTKVMLNRSNNFNCVAVKWVKRIGDDGVKT